MKDRSIQIIRVCAMISIVLYHCVCYYGVWGNWFPTEVKYKYLSLWFGLCSIALTSFVLISGMLYGSYLSSYMGGGKLNLIQRKFNRLTIPYLIWGLFILLILPDLSDFWALISGIHHLWFLLMMTVLFATVIALGRKLLSLHTLLALFILFYIADYATRKYLFAVPNYIAWKNSIHYMPAFLCGIATSAYNLSERLYKLRTWIFNTSTIITTLLIITFSLPIAIPGKFIYENLVIYIWLILIYTLLRHRIKINSENKIIKSLDRHSMSIYIVHYIIIWVTLVYIPPVIPFMEQHYFVAPIILFTVIFTISWGIATLSSKNKYSNYLLTGKINRKP